MRQDRAAGGGYVRSARQGAADGEAKDIAAGEAIRDESTA